jgi:succinate dehydrogenase hydrophobic anchor subunit
MASERRNGWDLLAVSAAVIALIMIGIYITVIIQQGGDGAAWFPAGLGLAALLSIYGAARAAPRRGLVLAVSGVIMAILGLLGILSIGFPILGAAVLALVAAARASTMARSPAE